MITGDEALHLARKYAERLSGGNSKIFCDSTAGWNTKSTLVSERGAIYIYTDKTFDAPGADVTAPSLKIGDGLAYVVDLPFFDELIAQETIQRVSHQSGSVTEEERTFWNNKVSAFIDPYDPECVILSKTTYE